MIAYFHLASQVVPTNENFGIPFFVDRVKNFRHCSMNIKKKGFLKHPINLRYQNVIMERKILCQITQHEQAS